MTAPAHHGRSWGLILLGVPALGAALAVLALLVLPSLYDAWRMQAWQPVRAEVHEARLSSRQGTDSRGRGTGQVYRAEARFRYVVGGQPFESTRVAINFRKHDNGDFQKRTAKTLMRAETAGRKVKIWVNPDNPADAVYDRSLRWDLLGAGLVFSLLFGSIGTGLLLLARPSPKIHKPGPA